MSSAKVLGANPHQIWGTGTLWRLNWFLSLCLQVHNSHLRHSEASCAFINCALCLYMVWEHSSFWLMSTEQRLKQPASAAKAGAVPCHGDPQAKRILAKPQIQLGSPSSDSRAGAFTAVPLRQELKFQEHSRMSGGPRRVWSGLSRPICTLISSSQGVPCRNRSTGKAEIAMWGHCPVSS